MCDLVTALAVGSAAVSLIGTGVTAVGQMQAGEAASAQAAYQAGVLRNNEILAQRAAADATARGEAAAQRKAVETSRLQGRQRAVLAGNGVDVGSGSATDIVSDTGTIGQLDQETIRSNAERESLYYKAQGMNFNAQANLARLSGDAAQSAGYTQGFGTLLSGVGSVASKWYDFGTNPINSKSPLYLG